MTNVEELLKNLDISSILFIDDQLELNDEEKMLILQTFLITEKENQQLREELSQKLEDEDIQRIYEMEEFDFLYEEEEKREIILELINSKNPELLKGHAKYIEEMLEEYFGSDIVDSSSDPNRDFKDYDLIIMDYNYSKANSTALDILNKKELNDEKLKYIVFISSHSEFEYETTSYKMTDSEGRQDLFRKYSSMNFLQFKAVLNYINKESTKNKDSFFNSLKETLLELESGKLMFTALLSVKGLLDNGVNDAISKLLLTSNKTMKALITEKLEIEGVSETTYLIDFSLALVRNLITDSVLQMKRIHEDLTKIQGWECEIWDYETDNHLRDLRRIELLDENVNKRKAPIEFGDIFEFDINGNVVRGILISQSCDLIIRKVDGKIQRNDKIVEIILEGTKKSGKNIVDLRLGKEEIVFDVRRKILVPSWILDLTSLDSENGNAKFEIDKDIDKYFTWGAYFYQYITNLVKIKSNEVNLLPNGNHISWCENIPFIYMRNGNFIDYKVKRIGRLDYLHTSSILKTKIDLETRVPLSLDLSNEIIKYSLLDTKLNNNESKLQFYYNERDKLVLFDLNNILNMIEKEGYEIKEGTKNEIITEIIKHHRDKIIINEQFAGQRMLIVNEQTNELLKKYGITIQVSKKSKIVNINCRFKKQLEETANQ